MKNYKETSKKSYHELIEEMDDKKGFKRSDLPRKKKEVSSKDDEPMISMAKSESYQKRSYDDQDRKPYQGRSSSDYKKPYTPREGQEKRPYTPREGSEFKKPYTPREGQEKRPYTPREGSEYKKPYDPNRSSEFKKPYTKPYNKPNEDK